MTETTLVRKRTQAKQRSDASGRPADGLLRPGAQQNGQQVVANIRKNSLAHRPPQPGYPPPTAPATRSDYPPVAAMSPVMEGGYPSNAANAYRQSPVNPNSDGYFPPQRQQLPPPPQAGSGYRPQQVPPHQSTLPPPQPHPSLPPPQPHASLPPPGSGSGYPSPRPLAQQQQYGQRPISQAAGPGGPGRRQGRTASGSGAALGGGPPTPQTSAPSTPGPSPLGVYDAPMKPPGPKGPATFQEMGFQSQKLEEKDCIIM